MLQARLVQAARALGRGRAEDAQCDFCLWKFGRLTQASVIIKQVRDPEIAWRPIMGVCASHFAPLENAYKEHGWIVI